MPRPIIAVALALLVGLSLTAAPPVPAQIYTWTDAQGRRQVSDRPPEGPVKDLKVQGGRPPSGPVSSAPPLADKAGDKKTQTLNEKALDFNKRQLEREEERLRQEKAEAEARDRARRCEQAMGYLRSLQAGGRATRIDPKTGERLFLDDKERERELVEAQRSADSWCKPAPPPGANPGAATK